MYRLGCTLHVHRTITERLKSKYHKLIQICQQTFLRNMTIQIFNWQICDHKNQHSGSELRIEKVFQELRERKCSQNETLGLHSFENTQSFFGSSAFCNPIISPHSMVHTLACHLNCYADLAVYSSFWFSGKKEKEKKNVIVRKVFLFLANDGYFFI